MKTTILREIGKWTLAIAFILTSAQIATIAQVATEDSKVQQEESSGIFPFNATMIEGVWDSTVTLRNCDTGVAITTFRAMDMFARGGTFTDTNAGPPTLRGPGFGTWEYLGNRRYFAVLRFFLYNPDGTFAGVRRIAQNITLDRRGEFWSSTVGITVTNPAGVQVATACGTAEATLFP